MRIRSMVKNNAKGKREIIVIMLAVCLTGFLSAVDKVILDQGCSENFYLKMMKNNVYMDGCIGIDIDNQGYYYFLDLQFAHIVKVDPLSGKLIRVISKKGRGPGELSEPGKMKIYRDTIYVADGVYGGVKIFDLDGKALDEFRTASRCTEIDIGDKGSIYVKEINPTTHTLISIYTPQGKKIGDVIPYPPEIHKDRVKYALYSNFHFCLDDHNHIIVLFFLKRNLEKYDPRGKCLWQRKISNELIDRIPPEDDQLSFSSNRFHTRFSVFNLDTVKGGDILVGHAYGGVIYNKDGEMRKLITFKKEDHLNTFRWSGKILMNFNAFEEDLRIYQEVF